MSQICEVELQGREAMRRGSYKAMINGCPSGWAFHVMAFRQMLHVHRALRSSRSKASGTGSADLQR